MKAERKQVEPEFVPVIITLESQEEVDAFFIITNSIQITSTFPAMNGWFNKLTPFRTKNYQPLWDKLLKILR